MTNRATYRVLGLVGSTALTMVLSRPAAADPPAPPDRETAEGGDVEASAGSQAASSPAPEPDAGNSSPGVHLTVGEIVHVEDAARGPLRGYDVVTSVDILAGDTAQRGNTNEPLEILRRAPAVYVESYNQGIISSDIGIRAFNTTGDIGATKLLVDGIPSNLHIGYPDLKAVSPLEIERIEVVKGTNDARYGLNNIAGNINVYTHRGGNERVVRVLGGSFGTFETQARAGIDSDALAQNYTLAYRRSGGHRDNSTWNRLGGSAKWFVRPTDDLSLGLIVRGAAMTADAPGYLTEAVARDMPSSIVAHAAEDGGEQTTGHASAHADFQIAEDVSLSLKSYAQTFVRNRWVRFDMEFGQQERVENERHYGAISVVTWRPEVRALGDVAVEWGVDAQLQDNRHQRFATEARERTGDTLRDHDFTFHTMGSYVQGRVRPLRQLELMSGLRVDRVGGSFDNELDDTSLDINDYGAIWQPKLSVVVTPVPRHHVYGNYGRTFQVGVGIGAYATQDAALQPSINDGWEVGYKARPIPWVDTRVAYWQQHASDEVRLRFDDSGVSENVGETLRRGVDVQLNVQPMDTLAIWGAYSWHKSRQENPGEGLDDRIGKELDHVPEFTAKAGVDYRPMPKLWTSTWLYAQGDYHLTKENDVDQYGDYVLLNLELGYDVLPAWTVGAQLNNILGADYDSAVWFKTFGAIGTQHNPGPGRAFYVTTTVTL